MKYLAYGWSSLRSRPALRDQAAAARAGARYRGWQGLLDAQRRYLDDYWHSADVEVEGDADTRDGLHMASLAGAWTALVAGFGGLRDDEGVLSLDPHLPDGISCLRFRLRWRDFRLMVNVTHEDATYTLRDGPHGELTIRHAGEELTLSTDSPSTLALRSCRPLLPARLSRHSAGGADWLDRQPSQRRGRVRGHRSVQRRNRIEPPVRLALHGPQIRLTLVRPQRRRAFGLRGDRK